MCVWPGFLALPSTTNLRGSIGVARPRQREVEETRVDAAVFRCMPEKMADSRFQAAPQAMNLAAASAAAAAVPPPDMPDLSHLTEEERRIIESVMMRQRQEEERENEIMR